MQLETVLFHGWGTNKAIFNNLRQDLSHYSTYAPDLPGHGMLSASRMSIDSWLRQFSTTVTQPINIIAWSMGGLYAISFAHLYPHLVKSLVLIATFAKYFQAKDYSEGLSEPILLNTFKWFEKDYPYYLKEFLMFQCMNNQEQQKKIVVDIYPDLIKEYQLESLRYCLDTILNIDYRNRIHSIYQPTLLIYGKKDRITPVSMGQYLNRALKQSQLLVFDKSGHIPFFSEPDACMREIIQFLNRQNK